MNATSGFYNRSLELTSDGSHTILLPEFGVHYHSVHGAVQESRHVFLKQGWMAHAKINRPVRILELGFGTGLNALLQFQQAREESCEVHYTTLDAFPVSPEMAAQLNYAAATDHPTDHDFFVQLHTATWNEVVQLDSLFTLEKRQTTLAEFSAPPASFDLIYFDAFAPNFQPELWTEEVFVRMAAWMREGALLVTYCAQGQVRRNMQSAGLRVERLDGPPGKREMLRARK